MPRLFNKIAKIAQRWSWVTGTPIFETHAGLDTYQPVICDPAADAAWEWFKAGGIASDIPCVIPPFEKIAIDVEWGSKAKSCTYISTKSTDDPGFPIEMQRKYPGVRYVLLVKHFVGDWEFFEDRVVVLDKRGRIVAHSSNFNADRVIAYDADRIHISFFFLGLLNARNVEMLDMPSPKKNTIRLKKTPDIPTLSYKVLKVVPATLKHFTQEVEEQAKSGEKREIPLHLVRGHFKDYRDGKGLFGRVKDVIWFQEQWRGKPENGIALKDYELHPPKAEHQE